MAIQRDTPVSLWVIEMLILRTEGGRLFGEEINLLQALQGPTNLLLQWTPWTWPIFAEHVSSLSKLARKMSPVYTQL